jgi:hypothetical protein
MFASFRCFWFVTIVCAMISSHGALDVSPWNAQNGFSSILTVDPLLPSIVASYQICSDELIDD